MSADANLVIFFRIRKNTGFVCRPRGLILRSATFFMPFIYSAYNNFANKGIGYESGKCKGVVLPEKSEADADGNCPVMAKLNVGKYSEAAFSVKIKVPQSRWSSGRASGKSVAAKEINNRLDEIRAMALNIYMEQSAVRDGVTAEEVKGILLGMASGQETLLGYFRRFIRNFEKRVGINRTVGSLRAYSNAYSHIERFLQAQYKLSDIPFSALDRSFIDKYDLYLRTERNLAPGTIINLTVQLKTIVGEAIADGIITASPFMGYEPMRPKHVQKYLTAEELHRIMTTPLHRQTLYHVRDMFLFPVLPAFHTEICAC